MYSGSGARAETVIASGVHGLILLYHAFGAPSKLQTPLFHRRAVTGHCRSWRERTLFTALRTLPTLKSYQVRARHLARPLTKLQTPLFHRCSHCSTWLERTLFTALRTLPTLKAIRCEHGMRAIGAPRRRAGGRGLAMPMAHARLLLLGRCCDLRTQKPDLVPISVRLRRTSLWSGTATGSGRYYLKIRV